MKRPSPVSSLLKDIALGESVITTKEWKEQQRAKKERYLNQYSSKLADPLEGAEPSSKTPFRDINPDGNAIIWRPSEVKRDPSLYKVRPDKD